MRVMVKVAVYLIYRLVGNLRCGMVHPNVLRNVGHDPENKWLCIWYGVERIVMLKYGITDLGLL